MTVSPLGRHDSASSLNANSNPSSQKLDENYVEDKYYVSYSLPNLQLKFPKNKKITVAYGVSPKGEDSLIFDSEKEIKLSSSSLGIFSKSMHIGISSLRVNGQVGANHSMAYGDISFKSRLYFLGLPLFVMKGSLISKEDSDVNNFKIKSSLYFLGIFPSMSIKGSVVATNMEEGGQVQIKTWIYCLGIPVCPYSMMIPLAKSKDLPENEKSLASYLKNFIVDSIVTNNLRNPEVKKIFNEKIRPNHTNTSLVFKDNLQVDIHSSLSRFCLGSSEKEIDAKLHCQVGLPGKCLSGKENTIMSFKEGSYFSECEKPPLKIYISSPMIRQLLLTNYKDVEAFSKKLEDGLLKRNILAGLKDFKKSLSENNNINGSNEFLYLNIKNLFEALSPAALEEDKPDITIQATLDKASSTAAEAFALLNGADFKINQFQISHPLSFMDILLGPQSLGKFFRGIREVTVTQRTDNNSPHELENISWLTPFKNKFDVLALNYAIRIQTNDITLLGIPGLVQAYLYNFYKPTQQYIMENIDILRKNAVSFLGKMCSNPLARCVSTSSED